jgi:E3 ubiquitin-protein ligase HECTD4
MKELECEDRMRTIRAGLASIIPLQTLTITMPSDLELRICGLPDIDLDFLKVRTYNHFYLLVI